MALKPGKSGPGKSGPAKSTVNKNALHKTGAGAQHSLRYGFEQHQATAVDSLLRLLSEPLGSLLTWAVMGIALALPLTLFLLLQNLEGVGKELDDISTLAVYLDIGVDESTRESLIETLHSRADISAVQVVTPEQALAEFESSSGFQEVLAGLDANPLPAVLMLTPVSRDSAQLTLLTRELQALPGVMDVSFDMVWLQRLQNMVGLAARLALLLGLMLALGVLLVIGNTIRLAIENRRAEIVVIKLVGGTDAYVARPFLYTGLWYGVGGGIIAVLLASISIALLSGPYARLIGSYEADATLGGLGISGTFAVLVLAAGLGWLGALLSVLRHLRTIEPR